MIPVALLLACLLTQRFEKWILRCLEQNCGSIPVVQQHGGQQQEEVETFNTYDDINGIELRGVTLNYTRGLAKNEKVTQSSGNPIHSQRQAIVTQPSKPSSIL